MDSIHKVKSISIWIFIIPFVSINLCLLIVTKFHEILAPGVPIHSSILPYFDGGVSISRTVRNYPLYLIFKPAMFLTSYLLIKYWISTKDIINHFNPGHKHIKKIVFFGIASAIFLTIHSLFLGIKIDNDFYKLSRRIVMLSFIIFELVAQAYLVAALYSFKDQLIKFINFKVLKLKLILVSTLIVVAIIAIPIISWPGDTFKFLKHALEWDYFLGVVTFYLLTYFMWRKKN